MNDTPTFGNSKLDRALAPLLQEHGLPGVMDALSRYLRAGAAAMTAATDTDLAAGFSDLWRFTGMMKDHLPKSSRALLDRIIESPLMSRCLLAAHIETQPATP